MKDWPKLNNLLCTWGYNLNSHTIWCLKVCKNSSLVFLGVATCGHSSSVDTRLFEWHVTSLANQSTAFLLRFSLPAYGLIFGEWLLPPRMTAVGQDPQITLPPCLLGHIHTESSDSSIYWGKGSESFIWSHPCSSKHDCHWGTTYPTIHRGMEKYWFQTAVARGNPAVHPRINV